MMDCLTMGTDQSDVLGPESCVANDGERGSGKMFAEQEIKFANFRHLAVQADVEDVLPQISRKGLLTVGNQPRAQSVSVAGDFGDNGINTVGRSAGHKANDKLNAAFWPARISHGRNLAERTTWDKSSVFAPQIQ